MLKFEHSVEIDRPVNEVFCYATRLENNAKWQSDIIAIEQISEGPFGSGVLCRLVNRFLGKRYESEFVISDFKPYQKCTYRFLSGPVTGESFFLFEPVNGNGRTLFTTRGELELTQFKVARFIVEQKAKHQIRTDMQRLKGILEKDQDDLSAGSLRSDSQCRW